MAFGVSLFLVTNREALKQRLPDFFFRFLHNLHKMKAKFTTPKLSKLLNIGMFIIDMKENNLERQVV
jgi:hypothetical protein